MTEAWLDLAQVRRAFARSAGDYERHDALQREVESRLFESLDYYEDHPERVLDVGCGTARGTARLKRRWRGAEVIALDVSLPMLREARRYAGWRKAFSRVAADALALPFPDRSMDVVYSNLCMQWCDEPRAFLAELRRVLKPAGLLVASSLGPDTLGELHAAWREVDPGRPHVGRFADMHEVGDAAIAAGLRDPVLDADHIVLEYPDVRGLLRDLKGLGATNADRDRQRGLTGKRRLRAMLDAYERQRRNGRIPATWEVMTM
ncbi:MAG TPA: malonyl-ACP O-methyltransferase BioC, partial [Rhodanobacteraceae bacterium]|nr:malonyl-ACP O-methyltransferase BioC [Rhodanobacteraceae bacterium]